MIMSNITDLCKQITTSYKNIYTKYYILSIGAFDVGIIECAALLFDNKLFKTPDNHYIYVKYDFEGNICYNALFTAFIFDEFPGNDFTIVNGKYLKERANKYESITIDKALQIFTEYEHIYLQTLTKDICKNEYNSSTNKLNINKVNISFKYQKEIEMLKNYNICITEYQNLINQFIEQLSKIPMLILESSYDYIIFVNEIKHIKLNNNIIKTNLSYKLYDKLTHTVWYETMILYQLLNKLINGTYDIVEDNEKISKILKIFDTYN